LAQSLNRISKNENQLYLVITLKEKAAENLDNLILNFPKSLWYDDAVKLRIALAGDLFMIGDKEQKKKQREIIDKLWTEKYKHKADIKHSFDVLTEMEPEAALDAIKLFLEDEKFKQSPNLKKEIITLIGNHFPEKGMKLLYDFERNDPDESVRKLASLTIDHIDMIEIPVHLNYFCYAAALKDEEEYKRLPENKSLIFSMPKTNLTNKKKVEKAVKRFFNNELTDVKFVCNALGSTNLQFKFNLLNYKLGALNYKLNFLANAVEGHSALEKGKIDKLFQFGSVSHNIIGFRVQHLSDGFMKDYDQISGKIRFFDKENKKEFIVPYIVDNTRDKLIAMRKGEKVAIIVLQFESEEDLEL